MRRSWQVRGVGSSPTLACLAAASPPPAGPRPSPSHPSASHLQQRNLLRQRVGDP